MCQNSKKLISGGQIASSASTRQTGNDSAPGIGEMEARRVGSLLDLLPKGRRTLLDVGARDGRVSRLLTRHFDTVVAIDLKKPSICEERVVPMAGDATRLPLRDDSFDTVLCSEVLEHIPPGLLQTACDEISRVARYDVVIGVPFRQDTRIGRTTCLACGRKNPPWGHVNTFDEKRLANLFPRLTPVATRFVERTRHSTNTLAAFLMDLGGNPWGTYEQQEPCIFCGANLAPPKNRSLFQMGCSKLGYWLHALQQPFVAQRPNWIHMVFQKRPFPDMSNGTSDYRF